MGSPLPALIMAFLVMGGLNIGLFSLIHGGRLGVSREKAIGAFLLTSLCSNMVYILLAAGFAFFVNAI